MIGVSADPVQDFMGAMAEAGVPMASDGRIVPDGKLHRYRVEGDKRGSKSGWYVLHTDDPPAGAFGCWKRRVQGTWSAKPEREFTPAERTRWLRRIEETKRAREEEERRARERAKERARALKEKAKPASPDHPYLRRKGVQAHGVRQLGERLLVPVTSGGEIDGLQFIDPDGGKRFLRGTPKREHYFPIGTPNGSIVIAEGYATAAAIHEATGTAAVVAFDASNVLPVAEAVRARFPEIEIIVAGDNDHATEGNPGRTAAEEAARAVGGRVAIPSFAAGDPGTDWNDIMAQQGAEAVARGLGMDSGGQGGLPEGHEEGAPDGDPLILDPSDPYPGAAEIVDLHFRADQQRLLHEQHGSFYEYDGVRYAPAEEAEIRSRLWAIAAEAKRWAGKEEPELKAFQPTTTKLNNLLDALRACCHLAAEIEPPCWLEERSGDPPPENLVSMANGILHLPTRQLRIHTPRFYTHNALGFDYEPEAGRPDRWLAFLDELWPDDPTSIQALQEMFAYFLTRDTRFQKAFLMVGPKRSGKGTIARVLNQLIGPANVGAPTLASLSTNFGLWPLIGKQLAIISDARLSGRVDQVAIAERLLAISGEDTVTIDRKYMSPWTGRLSTRFLILTNELPRLADASGALASRFIVLTLQRSFYGNEDPHLTDKLLTELPGIFNWTLEGWDRLRARGHFVQPDASAEAIREMEDLGSPVAAFIRDRCIVEPGRSVPAASLYGAWRRWCESEGRDHPGTAQSFGRDLRAAVPGLHMSQPRVDGDRVRTYEGIDVKGGF